LTALFEIINLINRS